ncbi:MAG: hypothetical protein CL666_00440 [Balneola sp.]|nr:hypothetical protein [Balneola sp.]|tara:strand:- start:1210 stop:3012 length:1803 start_codon:yes stop_codon:yes gene_type:complete
MKSILVTLLLLLPSALSIPVMAQNFYPGNYFYMVAEDDQSFFFEPSGFSPLQTGVFEDIAVSLSDHPLSAINRNPASVNQFSGKGYAYLDVKTLPEENVRNYYGCEVCLMSQMAYIYLPEPTPKRTQEPFLSTALFVNPLENERLILGVAYQFMQMKESYYRRVGYPYGFTHLSDPGLLSVDQQQSFLGGEDFFNKYGHFPTAYAGYRFSDDINVALKLSYNNYQGRGSMLSDNFGQMDVAPYPQTNNFDRSRHINYSHWDLSAGLQLRLNSTMDAGFTAGFLTGDQGQTAREYYQQEYLNEAHPNYDDYYYNYDSNFSQRDGFNRTGQRLYGSLEYNWQQHESRVFRLTYRASRAFQDLGYGLTSSSAGSYESQTFRNSDEEVFRISEDLQSTYSDGAGDFTEWRNQGGFFLIQDLGNSTQLRTGFQVLHVSAEETVSEVYQRQYEEHTFERVNDGPLTESRYDREHMRELDVTQNKYEFTGHIPLILRRSFGDLFSVEAGVLGTHQRFIRTYDQYFQYENDYVTVQEGVMEAEQNESDYRDNGRASDNWTHFNLYGSVVYSPFDQFQLRLMTFSDRRQINTVSNMDAFRFRVSAEIEF